MFTCVVGWTHAGVVVDSVHAGGVVLAVVVLAVIGVCLAALALKTWWAHAATGTQTQRRSGVLFWVFHTLDLQHLNI